VVIGLNGEKIKGSFQTVVVALNEEHAWDIATQHDVWQQLPFNVKTIQVFPKDPLVANGHDQTH